MGVRLACALCGDEIAPGSACVHGNHHARCCGAGARLFAFVFAVLLLAAPLAAQWPTPAKTANTPVTCPASCGVGKAGKLTAGWPSGTITGYTGRFLDSTATPEIQTSRRTLRARRALVVPERDRIYMMFGSSMVAYRFSSFLSRLELGAPLQRLGRNNGPAEFVLLPFDGYFYAEDSGGQWITPFTDGQDRLMGFDTDDRGTVYVAYSTFGWGALTDDEASGFRSRFQVQADGDAVSAEKVVSVKVGSKYFVVASAAQTAAHSNVWDVTDLAAPARLPNIATSIQSFARAADGTIAATGGDGLLRVYRAADILTNAPLATYRPPLATNLFLSVTSDGTNFYAVSFRQGEPAVLSVLTPLAGSYARRDETLAYRYDSLPAVRCGAGWLAVYGIDSGFGNVHLYRTSSTGTITEASTGNFFAAYYSQRGTAGAFVSPNFSQISVNGDIGAAALPVRVGTATYLVVSSNGLGDVYRIAESGVVTPQPQPVVQPGPAPTPVPCPCPAPQPQPAPTPSPAPAPAPPSGSSIVAIPPSSGEVGTWMWFQVQPAPTGDCRWNFGDGSPAFTTLCSRVGSHAYQRAGTFTVSVTASVPVVAKSFTIR